MVGRAEHTLEVDTVIVFRDKFEEAVDADGMPVRCWLCLELNRYDPTYFLMLAEERLGITVEQIMRVIDAELYRSLTDRRNDDETYMDKASEK